MSELTRCNYCSLQAMRRKATKRGVEVTLGWDDKGWVTAQYSDEDEPSAHFMEMTHGCVC